MTYLATVNLAQVMGVAAIILLVVDVGLFFAARSASSVKNYCSISQTRLLKAVCC